MRILAMAATIAALVLAMGGTATAQAVPSTGPYYVIEGDLNKAFVMALGTRDRLGEEANLTVVVLLSDAAQADSNGVARLDMAYEFRCDENTLRNTRSAFFRPDGSLIQTLVNVAEWEGISAGAMSEKMRDYACEGTRPGDETPVENLGVLTDIYKTWVSEQ